MGIPEVRPIPRHIAIIMDGNGRWAKQRGLPRMEGHRQGVEAVRRVVRRNLLDLGFTVLEADNGIEAREILEQTCGIVLLLSDVVMPGAVDGFTLARGARDFYHVPQVRLSGAQAPSPAECGDMAVLRKPFTQAQLAAALRLGTP